MRYLTKQRHCSNNFYIGLYLGEQSYEEYLQEVKEAYDYEDISEYYKRINMAQYLHEEKFKNYFNEQVIDYETVKSIAFDKFGELIPLDKNIYNKLGRIAKMHYQNWMLLSKMKHEEADISEIHSGHRRLALQRLEPLNKHDLKMFDITVKGLMLKLSVDTFDKIETYTFKTADVITEIDFGSKASYRIHDEELFVNIDDTLQYNVFY